MRKSLLILSPAVGVFFASFLFPFTFWPEMLNWPYFIARGLLPYRDFLMIHTPVLPYLLALIYETFGFRTLTLRFFGAALLGTGSFLVTVVVYQRTRRISWAFLAGLLSGYLALAFGSNHVWFESLLALELLGLYYCLISHWQEQRAWKMVLAGAIFGVAVLTKQTALYILPLPLVYLLLFYKQDGNLWKTVKTITLFGVPIVFLIAVFLTWLWGQGILANFWEWGVKFVFLKPFLGKATESFVLLPNTRQTFLLGVLFLAGGFVAVKTRSIALRLVLWGSLFALFFALPRFDYFHLIPAGYLLVIGVVLFLSERKGYANILLFLTMVATTTAIFLKNLSYSHTFLEKPIMEASVYLSKNYSGQSLFVLNGPDQLYFLTGKLPAVLPWVPQLPWYLDYYGDKFSRDFRVNLPDVIVFQPYLEKPIDGLGAYRPKKVVEYFFANYQKVKEFTGGVSIWRRVED